MKEEEWIKRLHDHLADFEAPVPDDLWDKIEACLPKELVAEKPKARTVPLWVRWTAAAALVGILVGTTVLLWPKHEETPTAPMASATKEGYKTPMESTKTNESESVSPVVARRTKLTFKQPTLAEAEVTEKEMTEAEVAEIASTVQPEQSSTESSVEGKQKTEPSQQKLIRELDEKIADYKVQHKRRVAVSLYASNGFGNLSSRNGVLRVTRCWLPTTMTVAWG